MKTETTPSGLFEALKATDATMYQGFPKTDSELATTIWVIEDELLTGCNTYGIGSQWVERFQLLKKGRGDFDRHDRDVGGKLWSSF